MDAPQTIFALDHALPMKFRPQPGTHRTTGNLTAGHLVGC